MTSKKTDKSDKKVKPSASKPATTKAEKSSDVKKAAPTKAPATKDVKSSGTKKSLTDKPAATKTKQANDVKKSSPVKSPATKAKKPVDTPKAAQPATVTAAPVANTIKNSPAKPNADEAMHLATQSMNHFITSKQERSMKHFFHTIAKVWQDMTTVEKLNTAFAPIIADTSDWNFLKGIWPTLIKDGLSERGDWVVVGVYPTKPKKLIFDQIFVHENGEWKIAELKLYTAD